jgi:prepilin peptidase CpaA
MDAGQIILTVCVVIFTLAAAVCDWQTKRLPNVLTVSAFACALLFHFAYGVSQGGLSAAWEHLLFALAGFGTGFGILFVLWLIGGGGGGDVKYMGALGAWLGAALTLQVFLVSAVLIAIGSMGVLAWEFCGKGMVRTKSRYLAPDAKPARNETEQQQRKTRRRLMPFGVPAALATWLVLVFSEFVQKQ